MDPTESYQVSLFPADKPTYVQKISGGESVEVTMHSPNFLWHQQLFAQKHSLCRDSCKHRAISAALPVTAQETSRHLSKIASALHWGLW